MGCRKLTYYQSQEQEAVKPLPLKITDTLSQKSALRKKCNEYYPFGLQANSSYSIADVFNNRLFNAGSELNSSTNNYETFYRNYDPALGRFNGIDIKATSFSSTSPYAFAGNDPVYYNDPLGDDYYYNPDTGWEYGEGVNEPMPANPGGGGYGGYHGTNRGYSTTLINRMKSLSSMGALSFGQGDYSHLFAAAAPYQSLAFQVNSATTSEREGTWTPDGGFKRFGSQEEGFLIGNAYKNKFSSDPSFADDVVQLPGMTITNSRISRPHHWGKTNYWLRRTYLKRMAAQNGASWLNFLLHFDRVQIITFGNGTETESVFGNLFESGKKTVVIEASELITAFDAIKKDFYKNIINNSNSSQRRNPYNNSIWGQIYQASKSLEYSIYENGFDKTYNAGDVPDSTIIMSYMKYTHRVWSPSERKWIEYKVYPFK